VHGLGFLDIAQDLKLTFPIEPFPLRPEEFRLARKRLFFRHIAHEALEVYESFQRGFMLIMLRCRSRTRSPADGLVVPFGSKVLFTH
jgi:hypothetical protein